MIDTEFGREDLSIFGTDAERDQGPGIAEHGMSKRVRKLRQELMGQHERQAPFAGFRQHGRKAVGDLPLPNSSILN